jgi:hypothetical protein
MPRVAARGIPEANITRSKGTSLTSDTTSLPLLTGALLGPPAYCCAASRHQA